MNKIHLGRYIDPLTDFGFKFLFGNEPNKDLLIGFLNDIFSGRKTIADLRYGPTEQSPDATIHRGVTVDLFCTGDQGEKFIVEMQRSNQEYFKDRSIFYTSRIINRQEKKGNKNWDYELPEIYFIGIMDFRFDENQCTTYFHDIHLTDRRSGREFYSKLGFIYIELPNFVKEFSRLEVEELEDVPALDRWIYVLRHLSRLDKEPAFLNKWIFRRLFNVAEVVNLKQEERMHYESSLKAQRDYHSSISFAEKKAWKKGMERGIERGIEKGMERGIEKGMEKKQREVITNLIAQSRLSDEQIAVATGASLGLIQEIRGNAGSQPDDSRLS